MAERRRTPYGISWCTVCGAQCRKTARGWRHMRPQPDGSPHEHNAIPGGAKPSDGARR